MGDAVTQAETTARYQRSDPEPCPERRGSLMVDFSCHARSEHAYDKSDSRAVARKDSQTSRRVVGVDIHVSPVFSAGAGFEDLRWV